MSLEVLQVESIVIDNEVQQRDAMNHDAICEYALVVDSLPPIVVYFDGSTYVLADGFHRIQAYLLAKKTEIRARVEPGTKRDAQLFAVSANNSHGVRPTPADKRRAVTTLLKDLEWVQWSNNAIAKRAGVSDGLVKKMRQELAGEIPIPAETRGTDGRVV